MADVYGDTAGFPGAKVPRAPIDRGRLAGIFCELHRNQFTGMARIDSAARTALVGFRAGRPVSIEDSTPGAAVGDQLMERGAITRAQYAEVIDRVTEGLVENEDLAFCEHAVALGYLSEAQVHEELSERTRMRLIQVLGWSNCEVTLDESDEALSGQGEYPQELGAIVYMGVRTFYDDQLLRGYVPDPSRNYLRLVAKATSVGEFFALDADELKLLRALDPQSPIETLVRASILDPGHALALLGLLAIADLCEFAKAPFAPEEADRSGTRPTPGGRAERIASRGGMPAVQPAREPSTSYSRGAMPAVQVGRPTSQAAFSAVQTNPTATAPASARSPVPRAPAVAQPESRAQAAAPAVVADATQEALREAAARASRRRAATPAAHRSVKELEATRPQAQGAAGREVSAPLQPVQDPAVRAEYAKAHLNELRQRRRQAQQQPGPAGAGPKRDAARGLRQAQELLRDQHYPRAEELLRELLEQEPSNEVFRTYYLWAKWRSVPEQNEAQTSELVDLAKKLIQAPEHGSFACYALGHLYLASKKDDLAEKYFRRAHTADKNNTDAERHLLILERRKQLATEAEANANRKIFGISLAGKPKG